MNKMQKLIAAMLVLMMLAIPLAGCGTHNNKDDNTLTIFMGSMNSLTIMPKLREKFPDINFVVEEYVGSNTSFYQRSELEHGEGGDIFFYTTFYDSEDAPKYLVDLSGYSFVSNYDKALLSTLDVNGAIYQIPGPISVRYIALNKTLFEENGWKIPTNFDELVDVCKQIRKDTPDIAPMGVGTLAMGFVFSLITSYSQMGYLDTAEGQETLQRFLNGDASFGDAFGEGLDMVSELIDAGAFMADRFHSTWDVTTIQLCNREAAMGFVMSPTTAHTWLLNGECKGKAEYGKYNNDDFIALPMFGRSASNKGLILGASNTWGISKYLEEKGNEKKLANALRVLEYIASEEGQLAIRSNASAIPALRDPKSTDIPQFMNELWGDPTNSIKDFFYYTGYEHIMTESAKAAYDAMVACDSAGMKEKVIEIADRLNMEFLHQDASSSSYGYAEDNLSFEQTKRFSCEALRAVAGADIAIATGTGITNGIVNQNGFAGRLFRGEITIETINVLYGKKNTNVMSVAMTGRELRELLQNGKTVSNADGASAVFHYWVSGAELVKKDGKLIGVIIGGNPMEDDTVYKIAILDKDYSDGFADRYELVDSGVDVVDALINYVKAQKTIKAE